MKGKFWIIIFAVVLLGLLYYFNCNTCVNCAGVQKGNLQPCDTSLACVNSQSENPKNPIAPLTYKGEMSPIPEIKSICKTFAKARVMKETDTYLHVEFRSKLLSWVDDAEFLWVEEKGMIEMRSAARCGYYDFKANRNRLETVRNTFDANRQIKHR
jgi:uncharacterized protein (DUF1499 family)